MRLILDIDTNTSLDHKEVFEAIADAFPQRIISLHLLDKSNENQFYDNEEPIIEVLREIHNSTALDEEGNVIGRQ